MTFWPIIWSRGEKLGTLMLAYNNVYTEVMSTDNTEKVSIPALAYTVKQLFGKCFVTR